MTWPGRLLRPHLDTALEFVRRPRELRFTLDEVRALLKLSATDGQGTCAEVRAISIADLADMRARIIDLRVMERVLSWTLAVFPAGWS